MANAPTYEWQPCPHCGKSHDVRYLQRHVERCVLSPFWRPLVMAILDTGSGRICEMNQYDKRRGSAISASGMVRQFGSWLAVATMFGLQMHAHVPRVGGNNLLDTPNEDDLVYAEESRILAEEADRKNCLYACRVIDTGREVRYVLR